MAEQNLKNHKRVDPLFFYVVVPVFAVNLVLCAVRLVYRFNAWHVWVVVVAAALLLLTAMTRRYALKVQDRVIRLEERIRMAALLPMEMQMLQRELTMEQIIALRFASDGELALLVEQAVRERLSPAAIKQQIRVWRADAHRV